MEEIEEHILKIDEDDSTNRSKMLDYRHWAYELLKIANEQAERVQELESFKNSVEYTVDTETIELIVENQDSDVALSSVETYDEEIYFLKKRVEDNDQAIVDLNKHVEELEDENVDLEQQNKLYRDLLTSRIVKQLIRLEDKGCFLPEEDREDFLKLKYAVEALEGEE